jgi:anti-sigma-K factor RskA
MNAPANEIHDAAGAYALDALDDLERARFEAHLARCPSCRQDVEDFRATAQQLGRAAAEEPPPAMRAAVLAAIGEVRQESPTPRLTERAGNRRNWVTSFAAAAAVALIALLAVTTIDARNARDDANQLAAVLSAPDAATVALVGESGSGRLTWSESEGRSVLVLEGMPEVDADRAYALWYIRDGEPRPIGLFDGDGSRVVATVDEIPADAQMVGITEEPGGGSPRPTGPILLLGETA